MIEWQNHAKYGNITKNALITNPITSPSFKTQNIVLNGLSVLLVLTLGLYSKQVAIISKCKKKLTSKNTMSHIPSVMSLESLASDISYSITVDVFDLVDSDWNECFTASVPCSGWMSIIHIEMHGQPFDMCTIPPDKTSK